jgi:hypothetical protein
MAQAFDYSNGSAVVQGGIIYYSPNCTRPVVIPSRPVYSSDPFRQPRLNAFMFKQPVWWSDGWAWLSFIPLSPSFVFTPFEPLCAMPRIEEVSFSYPGLSGDVGDIRRETRFRMSENDIQRWVLEEKRIIQVARAIQLRYSISGSPPPEPSSFHNPVSMLSCSYNLSATYHFTINQPHTSHTSLPLDHPKYFPLHENGVEILDQRRALLVVGQSADNGGPYTTDDPSIK